MILLEITQLTPDADSIALVLGLAFSAIFYTQYKKYEEQVKNEEMINRFLE